MDDSIYRLRNHDLLLLVVISLLGLGVLMVQSASMGVSGNLGFQLTDLGKKQLIFAGVGIGLFILIKQVDYMRLVPRSRSVWLAPATWLMLIAMAACVAVLIPHVGIEKNGARRWLPLGVMQVQPSELAKWAVVIFLAWWLTYRPIDLNRFGGFLITLVPIGLLTLLVVIQDFGTAALIAVVTLAMLLVGRVKLWHLAVVVPPVMAIGLWFVAHKEYRWKRMTAFLDPYAAPQAEGYHMIQSLLSFATGGLAGTGIGGGIQKLGYLPEDTTDFIFATVCEELGLFGALLIIVFYLGILMMAWQVMKSKRDSFGRMLAFGIGTMICTQATINLAVATVSVPTKGLSLPLISSGGSGLIITCGALGLLGSILKHRHAIDAVVPEKPRKKRVRKSKVINNRMWSEWTTA
ncbi:MAG: cell division protein FtsW [Burkholderiales bacterium]|nr:cell division protein FtsW [Phycisphaerae bacterium]